MKRGTADVHTKNWALQMRAARFLWCRDGFGLEVNNFSIEQGKSIFLYGPSGSGKSTLLSLVSGISKADSGTILLMGQSLSDVPSSVRDRLRAEQTGVIFQMFNMVPYLTPLENILLPLRFAPIRRKRCGNTLNAALTLTRALSLPDQAVTNLPSSSLSVGQQQRVAMARAMIGSPPLIIADEPTSALDVEARSIFMDVLFDQAEQTGAALLIVSHDLSLASRFDYSVALDEIARPIGKNAA